MKYSVHAELEREELEEDCMRVCEMVISNSARSKVESSASLPTRAATEMPSTVCWKDVRGEALAGYLYPACIRASVNDAVAKLNSPALTAYNTANPAVVSR